MTVKEKNHALQNAIGHIESILEDYEKYVKQEKN